MAKQLFTKKEIESYNKVAQYLNEQTASARDENLDGDGRDRVPCIRIVAGVVQKYNCRTGEIIP